jgi:hypothetical protein
MISSVKTVSFSVTDTIDSIDIFENLLEKNIEKNEKEHDFEVGKLWWKWTTKAKLQL